MGLKYHTIIVVPHSRAKYRKWRVSNLQIRVVLAATLLIGSVSTFFAWQHLTGSVDRREIARLRTENDELRQVGNQLETSFRNLQQQLAEFEDQTNSLAIVAGLEDVVDSEVSQGGNSSGAGGDFTSPVGGIIDLADLQSRTEGLKGRLHEIDESLRERDQWISSQPTILPVRGFFTSYYGRRKDPITGRPAFHNGVDISAPVGRPVHASADGIVVSAGRDGNLGRAVRISHGYGLTTIYGHLKEIQVRPGQHLQRGDVVGTVGRTGRTTGYHLHYEVRVDNRPQNPFEYLLD